jgi:peptidoglycan hydrolase CwlO-like protein
MKKRITETQILKNDVVKAYAKINEDIQNLQKQIDTLNAKIELINHQEILTERLEKNA